MNPAFMRRGLSLAALAAAVVLAGCASNKAELEAQAEAARLAAEAAERTPPPITLNESVAQAASIYVAFTRDIATIEGGFADAEAIQAALRRGSAYDPDQLSRGMVAYASILALQSPEFVAGVRQYAGHRQTREKLVADIVRDPRYASTLAGADAAAALITATLRADIDSLSRAANSVENDAYAIQAAHDPRRSWGVAHVTDREARLAGAKARSAETMLPSAGESARLFAAANGGGALPAAAGVRRPPPYPPVVEKALALAALAALGAAGDAAQANTDALQVEPTSQRCLNESKLNLFQCLAASRPSYEDIFCVGRHIVRDLATCTRGAAMPGAVVTISDVVPAPAIVTAPLVVTAPPSPILVPAPAPATPPPPTRSTPTPTITERLNTETARPD